MSARTKLSKAIGIIRRAKTYVQEEILKIMYNTHVLPHFDYNCSLAFHNCSQTLKNRIQRLQNRAARVITGDTYYDTRSKDVLIRLVYTCDERRISQATSFVTKVLRKKCPEAINEMFQTSCNDNHNLRSNNLVLKLSKPKLML